jgi:alkanesulfonate monooxygenase SsuD/methylene tetrahydromethanopterin reductase-like flavin-dependent oxidoreductase (luciferase family)
MKVSLCLPYMEREYDRATTLDWCRLADAGPFASLSCGERITSYTQDMRILLSAAAALTERIRLVPSLYVLPMHAPVRVAKELATLDVLSAGRVTVTVGVGGRADDYRALDSPFTDRLQRLDDGVAAMRRVWAGEPPFAGADPVGPTPIQAGGLPIWAGAMNPKAMHRASAWADGVYGFTMDAGVKTVREQSERARAAWRSRGRQAPYVATGFWFSLAADAEARLKTYVYEYLKIIDDGIARAVAETMTCFTGDAVGDALDAIAAEGCDECFLVPASLDTVEIERAADVIARRRW